MEQSVELNFFKKFKAIASLAHTSPIFQIFLFKKRFIRKSSKPGHGSLVLITSTVRVELSQLNFNFDDIKSYFLQVLLRDCQQITFVMLYGFFLLRKKTLPLRCSYRQHQDGENTKNNVLHLGVNTERKTRHR